MKHTLTGVLVAAFITLPVQPCYAQMSRYLRLRLT